MNNLELLSEEDWPVALMEVRTHFQVDLSQYPFRFSAPAGWGSAEQCLSQHVIYCAAKGRFDVIVEGAPHRVETGEFCWVSPGVSFCFVTSPEDEAPAFLRFRFSAERESRNLRLNRDFRICRQTETFEWAKQLVAEFEQPGIFSQHRMKCLAVLLTLGVLQAEKVAPLSGGKRLSEEQCARISEIVLNNPLARFSPAYLAEKCGLSLDYFSRLFQDTYGVPPRKWLLKQRLRHASLLLAESDNRISTIAEQHGYADLFLFCRQFKKEFGVSPGKWRKAKRLQIL